MSDLWHSLFWVFIALLGAAYYYVKIQYDYWKNRNIPYSKGSFPFGSLTGFGTKTHGSECVQKIYNEHVGKSTFAGMFFFTRPVGLVIDPELIKNVMVRDFSNFFDRGMYYNEEVDPLSAHLFSLDGAKWRRLRNKLSPTFTSGKMKLMFDIIAKSADEMANYLQEFAARKEEFEFKDLLGRYGIDVIGNCAFGIECNSLKVPDNKFREKGKKVFEPGTLFAIKSLLALMFPKIATFLSVKVTQPDVSDFFLDIVKENLEYRKKNNVKRNDFFQLLMDMEKKNYKDVQDTGLTFEEMAAQAFVFFLAGFETSSSTLSFCMFELGRHPDIQQKVREEIETVLAKHGGNVSYDAIGEMHYMNQVINESLRLYPPVDSNIRSADKDYNIPDTPYKLEKGTLLVIPTFSIQRDPKHYPNPLKFDPNRFSEEEVAKRHPFTFLPFGEGPRNCIGMRFGLMQVRMGLISILRKYKVSHSPKTMKDIKFLPSGQTLMFTEGVWMKIENI